MTDLDKLLRAAYSQADVDHVDASTVIAAMQVLELRRIADAAERIASSTAWLEDLLAVQGRIADALERHVR